jgi:hypothetical protein
MKDETMNKTNRVLGREVKMTSPDPGHDVGASSKASDSDLLRERSRMAFLERPPEFKVQLIRLRPTIPISCPSPEP